MERFNGYSDKNERVNGEIARFRRKRKKLAGSSKKKGPKKRIILREQKKCSLNC